MTPVRAAYFDVDETLISMKSMFSFLQFHWEHLGRPSGDHERARAELAALAATTTREQANRAYYRLYAGEDAQLVAAHGVQWLERALDDGDLFIDGALDAFRRHRWVGDRTVLVSGSFPACLQPLAAHLRADAVLSSAPLVVDGHYTGEVRRPMIGPAKADAVRADAAAAGFDLADCWAYGDHSSDLDMLASVGHPVVVGDDPVLTGVVTRQGWLHITRPAILV